MRTAHTGRTAMRADALFPEGRLVRWQSSVCRAGEASQAAAFPAWFGASLPPCLTPQAGPAILAAMAIRRTTGGHPGERRGIRLRMPGHKTLENLSNAGANRHLVGLLDFKSSVPREQRGRWVRFPCAPATLCRIDLRRSWQIAADFQCYWNLPFLPLPVPKLCSTFGVAVAGGKARRPDEHRGQHRRPFRGKELWRTESARIA